MTLDREHRRLMGFELDGEFYRFKALPFGASLAPARFTAVAVEFLRLVSIRVAKQGLHGVVLV